MYFRIAILFFLIAIGSLALGVWGIGDIQIRQVQTVFTSFLCLSVLALFAELFDPTRIFRRKEKSSVDPQEPES